MRMDQHPNEVRDLVVRTFMEFGAAPSSLFDLHETILIHDGQYAARSYRTDELMAMWLVEVGIVQFYDADGNMLRTVNLFQELEPMKLAA